MCCTAVFSLYRSLHMTHMVTVFLVGSMYTCYFLTLDWQTMSSCPPGWSLSVMSVTSSVITHSVKWRILMALRLEWFFFKDNLSCQLGSLAPPRVQPVWIKGWGNLTGCSSPFSLSKTAAEWRRCRRWSSSSFTWPALLAAQWSPAWAAGWRPHTEPLSSAGCCSAHSACGERASVQPLFPKGHCHHWSQTDSQWRSTAWQHVDCNTDSYWRGEMTNQEHWWLSEDAAWLGEPEKSSPERKTGSVNCCLMWSGQFSEVLTKSDGLLLTGMMEEFGQDTWVLSTSVLKHKQSHMERADS